MVARQQLAECVETGPGGRVLEGKRCSRLEDSRRSEGFVPCLKSGSRMTRKWYLACEKRVHELSVRLVFHLRRLALGYPSNMAMLQGMT